MVFRCQLDVRESVRLVLSQQQLAGIRFTIWTSKSESVVKSTNVVESTDVIESTVVKSTDVESTDVVEITNVVEPVGPREVRERVHLRNTLYRLRSANVYRRVEPAGTKVVRRVSCGAW